MNKTNIFICLTSLQFLMAMPLFAQNKTATNTLQSPLSAMKIDGELSDWADSLRYRNEEKQLNYTMANDAENIYFAIKIIDLMQQKRVLAAGITLSFDPKGKKKPAFSVTFPLLQAGTNAATASAANQSDAMLANLTKLRQIKVTGFTEIESDVMSTGNTYGFRAAIKYDKDGNLIYESSVPLKFFGALKDSKDAWAFNVKINGLPAPDIDGYDKSGDGRGRAGARNTHGAMSAKDAANIIDRPELLKSVDFWEKYYLKN